MKRDNWEDPIRIIQKQIELQHELQQERQVMKAIQEREQYSEGYEQGKVDAIDEFVAECEKMKGRINTSNTPMNFIYEIQKKLKERKDAN